jgi:hypothetical protein
LCNEREIGTFSELRVGLPDFYQLSKNVTFPKVGNADIGIHVRPENIRRNLMNPSPSTLEPLVTEIDDRLLTVMPCLSELAALFWQTEIARNFTLNFNEQLHRK